MIKEKGERVHVLVPAGCTGPLVGGTCASSTPAMAQPQKRIPATSSLLCNSKRQGGGFGGAQIALMYPGRRFLVELATPGGLLRQPSIIQSARNCFYTNSPPSSTYTSNRANLAAKLEQRLCAILILGDWINLCKLRLHCKCICI